MYEVEFTDEFEAWWDDLQVAEQESCAQVVGLLEEQGPFLGRPAADTLKGSRFPNLKELRIQHAGSAYRIFFAFDPRRVALLLLGGMKTDKNFYKQNMHRAEQLYLRHLNALVREDEDRGKKME